MLLSDGHLRGFSVDNDAHARFRCVSQGSRDLDVSNLSAEVRAAALGLQAARIGPTDRILFQGPQGAEALVLFWAAMLRGATFATVDQTWPEDLVNRATAALRPSMVFAARDRREAYEALFPETPFVDLTEADDGAAATSGAPRPHAFWAQDLAGDLEPIAVDPTTAAAFLFTSGSTGVPKAVALSRAALARGGQVTLDSFGWRPGERLVNLPEPHTMSGLRNALVAAPLGGLEWCVVPPNRRRNIFELVESLGAARCQRLVTGPVLIRQLVALGERIDPAHLADLKAIYCTGAALNPAAVERFHAATGVPILNYYGLTETGGICISQRLDGWDPGDHSLGRAAGADLRIVDDAGRPASTGLGELQVRSPQLMTGYVDDPAATARRFSQDWLRTGDRVRLDPDGRAYLIGREGAFIKTASTDRVAPEELEAVLEDHPAVADAAVTGVGAGEEFERIVALVVRRGPGADDDLALELAAYVRARLGPARALSEVRFVDAVPRQANGKIIRNSLAGLVE